MSVVSPVPDDVHNDDDKRDEGITVGTTSEDTERRIVDAFLSAEAKEWDTEEVEIVSWSNRLGAPFIVTLRELSEKELSDIFEMFADQVTTSGRKKQKVHERRQTEQASHIVAAAWVSPDLSASLQGPLYRVLQDKFKPLEIATMASIVMELSGGGEDAVTIVKN